MSKRRGPKRAVTEKPGILGPLRPLPTASGSTGMSFSVADRVNKQIRRSLEEHRKRMNKEST